jgi:cytochrome c-type biogenesis protein CcmH
MARRGRYADAAEILLGAVKASPRGSEGWLALGDALYAHAGGVLTPAAALAYDRADRAGLASFAARPLAAEAMERSGRLELASQWRKRGVPARPAAPHP